MIILNQDDQIIPTYDRDHIGDHCLDHLKYHYVLCYTRLKWSWPRSYQHQGGSGSSQPKS